MKTRVVTLLELGERLKELGLQPVRLQVSRGGGQFRVTVGSGITVLARTEHPTDVEAAINAALEAAEEGGEV